jgi:type I restriction enzyme S subunit
MRSDLKPVTIDQAVELIIDHRGRTPKKLGGDFAELGVQVISAKNVYDGRLHPGDNLRFVPPEMAARWMPTQLRDGDVLLTSEAPLGQVAYINGDFCYCLGQRLFALRARPDVANGRFLYYTLISPQVQGRLHARATGTTVQGIKQSELRQIELELPDTAEQARIASVLGALDDKIDTNRRLSNSLERMARVEFRRMFGGHIEGVERLGDHVSLIRGRSYKSSELAVSERALVTLKSVRPGGGYNPEGLKPYTGDFRPQQVVHPGDLVVAHTDLTQNAAVIGKPALIPDTGGFTELVASLDLATIRPTTDRVSVPFLYHMFFEPSFQQHVYGFANGSTVLHLNKEAIPSFAFNVPDPQDLAAHDALARPCLEWSNTLLVESQTLSRIRDALLPKLISGEIRVPDTGDPDEVIGPAAERLAAATP